MRIHAALTALGSALILQLAFVVCALPVVTAGPAAVALQRQLTDLRAGQVTGVLAFLREFRRAWRQSWAFGVVLASSVAGFAVGIPFWYGVRAWFGSLALAIMIFLLGLASAFYLCLLHASVLHRGTGWRTWLGPAFVHLATRPLRAMWAVVQLVTWLALLAALPSLALVGAGLVPSLVVMFTVAGGADDRAVRQPPAAV